MFIKKVIAIFMLAASVSCGGGSDLGGFAVNSTSLAGASTSSPVDAGTGFVFAISEKFSDKPQGILDTELVTQGDTPEVTLLSNADVFFPYRHSSGAVTVTERCFRGLGGSTQYRRIAVLTPTGETNPLTPCSDEIASPSGFTWIKEGKLSPNGQLLAATLTNSSKAPITVVFEGGQEIARYPGYANSEWIDDSSLVIVGIKLLTVRLGEEPVVLTEDVSGESIGRVDVSPDGTRLAFEWGSALWLISTDGTGLRQLLPAERYIFPAWSPDGKWVVVMQREAPSVFDAQLLGFVGGDFVYTNLRDFTMVNTETGEIRYADGSKLLNDSQMPQGGLSWY